MGAILNDVKQGANMFNSVHTTGPVECLNDVYVSLYDSKVG